MQKHDTKESYELRKEAQKKIYLAKVLAHDTENQDEVIKEAVEKFEREFLPFKETYTRDTQLDENTFLSEPITSEEHYKSKGYN